MVLYLLYCLLNAVHNVSNTTGVYGAYLKNLSSTGLKKLEMKAIPVIFSEGIHETYNMDCLELLELIKENDIIYMDPPYNSRQYGSNYHLLETISKNDISKVKIIKNKESVSGLKENVPTSNWCSKIKIKKDLEKVLSCSSQIIFMSYNTEGLLTETEITNIFKKYGEVEVKRLDYRKYKSNKNKNEKTIEELLFCLKK